MVDVYIISGFLGTGKTSLIQSLIAEKNDASRWVVLVNEFAQHGADGAIIQAQVVDQNVDVVEVAGGCGCCAAMLPFQQAIFDVLKSGGVDVLFVEASGLGHLGNLKSNIQSWVHDLGQFKGAITLLNPQHFFQEKYRQHAIYQQQILFADGFVVNKTDIAPKEQTQHLEDFLSQDGRPHTTTSFGKIAYDWLSALPTSSSAKPRFLLKQNEEGSRYFSNSMAVQGDTMYSLSKLIVGLSKLDLLRLKGCVMTDQGPRFVNLVQKELSIAEAPSDSKDFFIEWIDETDYSIEWMTTHFQEWIL